MQLNYNCEHCGKHFAKEKTLLVHVCEKKRRYLARNEKHTQMALMTYQKFYEIAQKGKNPKTFEDFINSPYYNAFIKFGSFMTNTRPVYPERFIDYVVTSGVKLDHWCRDELYDKYLVELIKKEPADGAIQRTIQNMMDWADEKDAEWEHYFLYVNLNRAANDIRQGRISPWLILNSKGGRKMLSKMNDEQLEIIGSLVDPMYWKKRFTERSADLELCKDVVAEAGIQ
jgi:hypothetical protein